MNKYKNNVSRKFKLVYSSNPQPLGKLGSKMVNNNPGNVIKKNNISADVKNLAPGSESPLAYVGKREFPEWYRPYTMNYFGHGFLICAFMTSCMLVYVQRKQTLQAMGRLEPVNYRDDHFVFSNLFYRRTLERETREWKKISVYDYTRRYIKESGF